MKKAIINTILSLICYENTMAMNFVASTPISGPNLPNYPVFPNTQQNSLTEVIILKNESRQLSDSEDSPPAHSAPMLSDESEGQILEPCSPPKDNFPITYPIRKTITELIQDVIQKFSTMETRLNDLGSSESILSTASQDFTTTLRNLMGSAQTTLQNIQKIIELEQILQTYRQEYLMQQRNVALVTLGQIQQVNTIEELINLGTVNDY